MKFQVIGLNAASAETTLTVDAVDAVAARAAALASGVAALQVRAAAGGANNTAAPRVGAARLDIDLFCQELLAMLQAGIGLREALETLRDKSGGNQGAIGALLTPLHEGKPLSAAMQAQPAVFPVLLVESIRAAERTSDIAPALARYTRFARQRRELRGKLVAAALYPMILMGVSLAVLLFLVGYIIPRFAQIYADLGDRLPAASRGLMQLGLLLQAQPLLLVLLVAGAVALLVFAVRGGQAQRIGQHLLRQVPRLNRMMFTVQRAQLYRSLAMLLAGGVPVLQALGLARGVLHGDMLARSDAAALSISQGQAFSDSFDEAGLSTVVADRFFRVGERAGNLAEMMDRAADFHEDEIARTVDWIGRIIGPVLMLFMGALIGAVVVLMYLPIFQLTEALQ